MKKFHLIIKSESYLDGISYWDWMDYLCQQVYIPLRKGMKGRLYSWLRAVSRIEDAVIRWLMPGYKHERFPIHCKTVFFEHHLFTQFKQMLIKSPTL